jgi:alpha-mannosidase
LDLSPSNVVLSALKLAKDGSTVVRVYEAAGQPVTGARLRLNTKLLSAEEANLMEDSIGKLKVAKGTVEFNLHPFEIKTFKLRMGKQETRSALGLLRQ